MNTQARIFFGVLLAGASMAAVACGDDDSDSTGSTTTTTSSTGGAGGAGGGAGGGVSKTCADICTVLYNCGLEMKDGMKLCPGFKGGLESDAFVKGSMDNGCEATCEAQPALGALVDGENCEGTITTLKGLNATFKDTCENGLPAPGTGGAGGAG